MSTIAAAIRPSLMSRVLTTATGSLLVFEGRHGLDVHARRHDEPQPVPALDDLLASPREELPVPALGVHVALPDAVGRRRLHGGVLLGGRLERFPVRLVLLLGRQR